MTQFDPSTRASQWIARLRARRMTWVAVGIVADLASLAQMDLREWLALNLLTLVAVVAGRLAADVRLEPVLNPAE